MKQAALFIQERGLKTSPLSSKRIELTRKYIIPKRSYSIG